MSKRTYRLELHCPRCGKDDEYIAERVHGVSAFPIIKCRDCLSNDRLNIEMDIVGVKEVIP